MSWSSPGPLRASKGELVAKLLNRSRRNRLGAHGNDVPTCSVRGGIHGNPRYGRSSGLGAGQRRVRAAHHDETSGGKLQWIEPSQTVCGFEKARGQGDQPDPTADKDGGMDSSEG